MEEKQQTACCKYFIWSCNACVCLCRKIKISHNSKEKAVFWSLSCLVFEHPTEKKENQTPTPTTYTQSTIFSAPQSTNLPSQAASATASRSVSAWEASKVGRCTGCLLGATVKEKANKALSGAGQIVAT